MSSSDLGEHSLARDAYESAKKIFQQTDPVQAGNVAQLLDKLPATLSAIDRPKVPSVEVRPSNEAAIREAITKLDLRPRGMEIFHPEKADAIEFLKSHASEALEPMLAALKTAGDFSRATLLYLLGETRTQAAMLALVEALRHENLNVRYEAITAIQSFPIDALQDSVTIAAIQSATLDPVPDVRKVATQILSRLGSQPAREVHWAEGAATWEQFSQAFIRSQIQQPNPDFQGWRECLKSFSPAERHGAWIRLAQAIEKSNPDLAIRCYVEALANDPSPNSIAWDWLCGQYNPRLRVLEPSQPHSAEMAAELKARYTIP